MREELYADGIGEITVTGTIVRIDLVSLSQSERDATDTPKSVFRQRVIMSTENFANSVDLMQKALQGLIDGGAIKRTPAAENPSSEAVAPEAIADGEAKAARQAHGDAQRQNGSPNFN